MSSININVNDLKNDFQNIKVKRLLGLVIDQIIWYFIYLIILLGFFLILNGSPSVSGNLMYYKDHFDEIIKSRTFTSLYLLALIVYEVVVPILNNGKSISKKKLGLYINCKGNSKMILAIRGIVKIIILNPYGVIAYLLYNATHLFNTGTFSNVLISIFAVCATIVFANKEGKGLHDLIAGTYVSVASR